MRGVVVTTALLIALAAVATVTTSHADDAWTPASWKNVDILEILTIGPEEGKHWSKLWLVVLDDQIYLRLGSRAAGRVERNVTAPQVAVKIEGQQFDSVQVENAPEMTDRVAAAMAEKYWSDRFIRYMPHPMTVRLVPR